MPQTEQSELTPKGTWLSYRPEIKILDCTIRDGGLINDHQFEDGFVKAVYNTCVASGVDTMEIGYKTDRKIVAPSQFGDWKFCDEDALRRILDDNPTDLKISIMADAERTDYKNDILPKDKSVIDIVRVATYIHQIPTALDMVKDAHDKGYKVGINLMAVTTVQERELDEALQLFAKAPVYGVFIVDSFGAYYSEQIHAVTKKYLAAVKGTGIEVGIHAHNNQMLAYANTLEALITGANHLDATINGMGRGAGNCPLELLLGFLKNPKFNLRPVLECIRDYFVPLEKQGDMEWGYRIPYMITGQLNQHPRSAIKARASENPDDYVAFYDHMIGAE
ncbi:MAG: aldolase catalytic domain-containing protein [Capsulimonadaceae bacterium]|nr:aldolase catalytic domain-containing protein [Capsulimonadaceae bacterium]